MSDDFKAGHLKPTARIQRKAQTQHRIKDNWAEGHFAARIDVRGFPDALTLRIGLPDTSKHRYDLVISRAEWDKAVKTVNEMLERLDRHYETDGRSPDPRPPARRTIKE